MRDKTNTTMKKNKLTIILTLIISLITLTGFSATFYVDRGASSGGDGTSWANAWNNTSSINWNNVNGGDSIEVAGGSYSAITFSKSGSANSYITIKRSLESGKNGAVTIATPIPISASYLKFDGQGYVNSGGKVKCGIIFTCNSATYSPVSFTGGQSITISGQKPWFKYCYFDGTFTAGQGNSLGVRNNTGFVLENCWFFQSSYEDQLSWSPSGTGGTVAITNCVFQDNVRSQSNPPHRDILNTWTGSGGYRLYIVGNIIFNSAGVSPQGDGFLLQDAYGGGAAALTEVVTINNVCYNYARLIAFGSKNSGHNGWVHYNNTIYNTTFNSGYSSQSPASSPKTANTLNNSSWINSSNPLGNDGIPFTEDDGFNLTANSSAINGGSDVGVDFDILNNQRTGKPDLGAYEFGSVVVPPDTNPPPVITNEPPVEVDVVLGETFDADEGKITAPFVVNNGKVSQSSETSLNSGGRAEYLFKVNKDGEYYLLINVNAPNNGQNSFFVNINGEPTDPENVWDIEPGDGDKAVAWRGNGEPESNYTNIQLFTLQANKTNKLIIIGREQNVEFNKISLVLTNEVTVPPIDPGCTNYVYITNIVEVPYPVYFTNFVDKFITNTVYLDKWFTNTVTINYTNYLDKYITNTVFVDKWFTNTVIPDLNTVIGTLDKNNKTLNIQATFK